MATEEISSSSDTSWISISDTDYDLCHDTADGTDIYSLDINLFEDWMVTGQQESDGYFNIGRSYVYFDTSVIPAGATILSVTLSLYSYSIFTDNNYNIVIQNGQPTYPHIPLEEGDINYTKYSGNGGQIASSAITADEYNDIVLNDDGINWVNKGGTTKLCLRSSRDISSTEPGTGDDEFAMWYFSTNLPKLTIIYVLDAFESPVDEILDTEIELPELELPDTDYDINIDYNWSHLSGRVKPLYTKEDLDKLRARCVRYLENLDKYCQVINRNKETVKTWLQQKYDDTTYSASSDFEDVISPQYMNTLYFDKLELTDFGNMINHFIRNHNRNNLILNGNFNTVTQWINDYASTNDNNLTELPMNTQQIADDEPDLKMLHTALSLLNRDFNSNIKLIYGNLQIIKEWIMV